MGPEYWMGGGFIWMWIFPVIFIVLMIWMMSGRGPMGGHSHNSDQPNSESARDILDKRFAKGEISKEEYEEMKKSLNG